MIKLQDGAYTGDKNQGNPYSGDAGRGIAYDLYEAQYPRVIQEGNFPLIQTAYRSSSHQLIGHTSFAPNSPLLDLGSGTGISTLELLLQKQPSHVTAIELSEGMMNIAKYKFHQAEGDTFLPQIRDEKLLAYWKSFRQESAPYKDKVTFVLDDVQTISSLPEGSFAGAIANQSMHWTDLEKTFSQLRKLLQPGAELVWTTSSHFYNDAIFPAAEYGFRYNDFLAFVLEDVCKNGNVGAKDYKNLSLPAHTLKSISALSEAQGFKTIQAATYVDKVDLQVFAQNHVSVFVKQLVTSHVDEAELNRLIQEALGRTIISPLALGDTQHKYEIMPVLISTRL